MIAIWLAAAHGAVDLAGGFLLGSTIARAGGDAVLPVLAFNALSSVGQVAIAARLNDPLRLKQATIASILLTILAVLIFAWSPALALLIGGIAAALFHVGAGGWSLVLAGGRATIPGLFAAPGVVGLAAGMLLGLQSSDAASLIAAALAMSTLPFFRSVPSSPLRSPVQDSAPILIAILIAAIAIRSAAWNHLQLSTDAILAIALAAGLGKALGGLLADRIGPIRWTVIAMTAAAIALLLHAPLVATALLMSTTAVGLTLASRMLPQSPATAASLAIGAGIAIGSLPLLFGFG